MKNITVPLSRIHPKKEFACGKAMLDDYLHKQANQDIKRKLSACFVLLDKGSDLISGYYTLSNNSISQELIPHAFKKNLPKSYKSIPTTLMGRLAIDSRFQGKGIGKALLLDALRRSYETSNRIASFAVVVDPLDIEAERFYKKAEFITLPGSERMFLPMSTIKTLFE